MNGKLMLYIDQYGGKIFAKNLRELQEKAGGGRIFKVYTTTASVEYHIGYGVGNRWFTAYTPFREIV